MYCYRCGTEITDESKYCYKCGCNVTDTNSCIIHNKKDFAGDTNVSQRASKGVFDIIDQIRLIGSILFGAASFLVGILFLIGSLESCSH